MSMNQHQTLVHMQTQHMAARRRSMTSDRQSWLEELSRVQRQVDCRVQSIECLRDQLDRMVQVCKQSMYDAKVCKWYQIWRVHAVLDVDDGQRRGNHSGMAF